MSTTPTLLYHYTNQPGLLGIFGKAVIWATQIHYLNDTKEFWHAFEMAKTSISKRLHNNKNETEVERLTTIREEMETLFAVGAYVASFSEHSDSLGQWRGYVGSQPGFAIGFDFNALCKIALNYGAELKPCIYDRETQSRSLDSLVHEAVVAMHPTATLPFDGDAPYQPEIVFHEYIEAFQDRLFKAAPLMKHSAFADEKEWRIVYHSNKTKLDIKHRPGQSMLLPYVEIGLLQKRLLSCIREVVIGPCAYPELSRNSLEDFLCMAVEKNPPTIKLSRAPFRYW